MYDIENESTSLLSNALNPIPIGSKNASGSFGKGKPYNLKFAKKKVGAVAGMKSAPGSVGSSVPGIIKDKFIFKKKSRFSDMNRKRGQKSKLKGIYESSGMNFQRPIASSNSLDNSKEKNDEEPGIENKLVLCSAKDRYVLNQDCCIMCGALGADDESCLISCTQCGQCYHPYCVSVKVTKVILEKGWRCLDCTVCEGCGEKNDEARLILCDECDISFHIYCTDPPLQYVPQGTWKCKWCMTCSKCGSNSPGENCTWTNNYTECGPCASELKCSHCKNAYNEKDLIIVCSTCKRWLHCKCDGIENESDAEKCNATKYQCSLCRPKDVLPAHLAQAKKSLTQSELSLIFESTSDSQMSNPQHMDTTHTLDGIFLSDDGFHKMKGLQLDVRKRRKMKQSGGGMADAIESVAAGVEDDMKDDENKEDMTQFKDGQPWDKTDMSPPQGFTVITNDQGLTVLRKKRQRNLQKVGIGGFNVRNRITKKDNNENDENVNNGFGLHSFNGEMQGFIDDKRKKPKRKNLKTKLIETYPEYLQEAFFGKTLIDIGKNNQFESDSTDDELKSDSMLSQMYSQSQLHPSHPPTQSNVISQTNIITQQQILIKKEPMQSPNPNYNQIQLQQGTTQQSMLQQQLYKPQQQITYNLPNENHQIYNSQSTNIQQQQQQPIQPQPQNPQVIQLAQQQQRNQHVSTPNHLLLDNNSVQSASLSMGSPIIQQNSSYLGTNLMDPNSQTSVKSGHDSFGFNISQQQQQQQLQQSQSIQHAQQQQPQQPNQVDTKNMMVVDSFKDILNNKNYNYDIVKSFADDGNPTVNTASLPTTSGATILVKQEMNGEYFVSLFFYCLRNL